MTRHIDGSEISAYLDGALSAEGRARADDHVRGCSSCRAEWTSLRRLKLALQSAPRKNMPADLALALERRFVHARSWRAVFSRPSLWVPAGSMVAAVLTAVIWLQSAAAADEIPLEPLLAAHARYSAEALVPEENLVASTYSDQLTSLESDASDAELE